MHVLDVSAGGQVSEVFQSAVIGFRLLQVMLLDLKNVKSNISITTYTSFLWDRSFIVSFPIHSIFSVTFNSTESPHPPFPERELFSKFHKEI